MWQVSSTTKIFDIRWQCWKLASLWCPSTARIRHFYSNVEQIQAHPIVISVCGSLHRLFPVFYLRMLSKRHWQWIRCRFSSKLNRVLSPLKLYELSDRWVLVPSINLTACEDACLIICWIYISMGIWLRSINMFVTKEILTVRMFGMVD